MRRWAISPTFPNPYLDRFLEVRRTVHGRGNYGDEYMARRALVREYAWAVPTEEAIRGIAALGPIIELGAGTGYWASLIQAVGGQIRAFDIAPPTHGYTNGYGHKHTYLPVFPGGTEVLATAPERTLFLCWPCYDQPWAYEALKAFRGEHLVYVGEGAYGCTADGQFHELLGAEWEVVREWDIPQWPGIHDAVTWYARKGVLPPANPITQEG